MCFYIDLKHPNKKIAKRDIVCYKVLMRETLCSPFQHMQYKLGKLYKIFLGKPYKSYRVLPYCIDKGFHSYSNKRKIEGCYRITQTWHCIVKGIIPKGAEYYYNSCYHEYVSNQIKLLEIIK